MSEKSRRLYQGASENAKTLMTETHHRHRKRPLDQLGNRHEAGQGSAPAVILVRPQLGVNIGAAARAMLNFGLTDLRLVAPRDGWPNPEATPTASGAASLLENAQLFDTVEDAVADLTYLLAATARRRELEIPVVGVNAIGADLHARANRGEATGILFGPENSGLANPDVALSDAILTYPVNPGFQSLNLAQAVMVFSFIWGASANAEIPEALEGTRAEVAPRSDLTGLFGHLEDELDRAGFFYPPEKRALMTDNIRAPLTRARMTEQEVRTFRGIVKALALGRGKHRVARDD